MKVKRFLAYGLALNAVFMNEAGADGGDGGGMGGAGGDDNGGTDALSGLRTKFSNDAGELDGDRLLNSYHGLQQQNTQLSQKKSPDQYEYTMPEGAGEVLGEIDTANPVFETLSEWGKKHGVSQEAMTDLIHAQYGREVDGMQSHQAQVKQFEESMGKDWGVKKDDYNAQLESLIRNHENGEDIKALFNDLLTMPAGVDLIQSMLAGNRDPYIGGDGGQQQKTVTKASMQELKSQEMTLRKEGKTEQANEIQRQLQADIQIYNKQR